MVGPLHTGAGGGGVPPEATLWPIPRSLRGVRGGWCSDNRRNAPTFSAGRVALGTREAPLGEEKPSIREEFEQFKLRQEIHEGAEELKAALEQALDEVSGAGADSKWSELRG